jgi:hypothetical protein
VLTQEFTLLKALVGGALVGLAPDATGALHFESGISGGGYVGPAEAAALGPDAWLVVRDRIALDRFGVPFANLVQRTDQLLTATDFNVEPVRWIVDEDALAQGLLVFRDPRGPNGVWEGGGGDDLASPFGEDCSGTFSGGTPDPGCTTLEVISANIERITMAGEIVGSDRIFDPPETVAELLAMLDGDPRNDRTGDPFSGPDGIRWNDFDANGDGEIGDGISETGDQNAVVAAANRLVVASYFDCLRATASGGPLAGGRECYVDLDPRPLPPTAGIPATRQSLGRLVGTLPVGLRVSYRDSDGNLLSPSAVGSQQTAVFPLQRLSPIQLEQLIVQGSVDEISRDVFSAEELAALSLALGGATIPATFTIGALPGVDLRVVFFDPLYGYDVDADGRPDVDSDDDRTLDFIDDGLAGPVSDDNILCATGIPGDVLQQAAQLELDSAQLALLLEQFPNGLPPRSPIFCRAATAMLDADADDIADLVDVCPTVTDPDQADADGDGVGDLCDNCMNVRNPRIVSPPPAALTTTGGQRDDDADGFGNACDAQVVSFGPVVTTADWNEFGSSIGRAITANRCGTSGLLPCSLFDLDGTGAAISAADFRRAKSLVGTPPGPRCDACGDFAQLPCEGPGCPAP